MSTHLPLAGKTVVVTRPQAQANGLVRLIEAAGGEAIRLPLFEIEPFVDEGLFKRIAGQLADFVLVVFVSPNAVQCALPSLLRHAPWPAGLPVAVPGPGTARALAALGVSKILVPPERYDTEALLELPELEGAVLRGRRVLVFCGEGGRAQLSETMAVRGADVQRIDCYRRVPFPDAKTGLMELSRNGQMDALVVTSSEGLRLLYSPVEKEFVDILAEIPIFVPHARIAELAESLGIRHIVRTAADNPGIVAALCAYNWS